MLEKITGKFISAGKKIRSAKNILQNRTAVSLLSIFATSLVIFLMTGALYFRNEVIITDGNNTYQVFTMLSDPEEILEEQGFELQELDYYSFGGFQRDVANLSINRSFTADVSDNNGNTQAEARYGDTVGEILARAGIETGEFDLVVPGLNEVCTKSNQIDIKRAFEVKITIDGATRMVSVKPDGKTTVGSLLERIGTDITDDDFVSVELTSIVTPKTEISVSRVRYVERITVNSIPYKTVEEDSILLPIGQTKVTTKGINGSEQIITREKIVDGIVVESEVISTEITNQPVDEVISHGTALADPYSKREFDEIDLVNGLPVNYEFIVSGKSCAYTAKQGSGTASGRKLQVGTVAVDPKVIPYGSLLYIVTQDGKTVYGAAVAADTGDLTDVIVDLYMGTTDNYYDEACDWGARNVDVYVINTGIH